MMRAQSLLILYLITTLCSITMVFGDDPPPKASLEKYEISAWGWLTYGRIEGSYYDYSRHGYYNHEKEWLYNTEIGYLFKRNFSERSWGKLHVNHALFYPVKPKTAREFKGLNKSIKTRLLDASIYLNFFQNNILSADMRIGYFSYKYNTQAMNLGEYLFRSLPYPQYLTSGFEIADKVKIPGAKFGMNIGKSLRQDIFIRSETEMPPLYDFSFAYLINYTPCTLIDISAGIDLYRIISVDKGKTTPSKDTVAFNSDIYADKIFTHYMDETDSVPATFAGTKIMGRMTIDPKFFFSHPAFGKEDLKIYTETIMLGLKNYPSWHEEPLHRIPIMVGFNIPSFKILDIFSFEVEYFASPYANSTRDIWDSRTPLPDIGPNKPESKDYDTYANKRIDNWKWSLYSSKKIGKYLRFSAQIANDHTPRTGLTISPNEDITQVPGDWYWMFRVMYYI
ncbi:MAG: hypothetical protein HQK83_16025 [Fibrobacteria bacterium]|nr:hypothetical protein [Fibrobacteria bacterium]